MNLNFYFSSHIVAAIYFLIFSFFILLKNKKSELNRSFFLFGLAIFNWLLFSSFAIISTNKRNILFWYRMSYIGIIFIPSTFFYFISCLINLRKRIILVVNWLLTAAFVVLLWLSNLLIKGVYEYSWGYYPMASFATHPLFLAFFNTLFTVALILLFLRIWGKKHVRLTLQRTRLKYVFFGSLLGVVGIVDFLPNYGIDVYPFGFVFMIIFPTIYGYAIVRYRLMDIRVAVSRAGIFLFVYALVLGLPFWIGYHTNFGFISFFILFILATGGPLIYRILQKKADNILLAQQKHYQKILLQAAGGMVRERDLDRLLKLIVYIVKKAIKIRYAAIFAHNIENKTYVLEASKRRR